MANSTGGGADVDKFSQPISINYNPPPKLNPHLRKRKLKYEP